MKKMTLLVVCVLMFAPVAFSQQMTPAEREKVGTELNAIAEKAVLPIADNMSVRVVYDIKKLQSGDHCMLYRSTHNLRALKGKRKAGKYEVTVRAGQVANGEACPNKAIVFLNEVDQAQLWPNE